MPRPKSSPVKAGKLNTIALRIVCLSCRGQKHNKDFYTSVSDSHVFNGKLPWCKECTEKKYLEYLKRCHDDYLAMYYTCRKFDCFYSTTAFDGAKKNAAKNNYSVIGSYFRLVNSFRRVNGYGSCFDESWDFLDLNDRETKSDELQLNPITLEKINDDEMVDKFEVDPNRIVNVTESDIKAQEDVVRLLGYDPFLECDMADKVPLCNDLVSYLDEDTVEDGFKCSVVIQIVVNNNQIRKTDIAINLLSSSVKSVVSNCKDIENLTKIKNILSQANDRLSKENNIALKHRGGASQNSTLGSMMKKLREMDFDKAEHDYYDMCKAYGIRQSAEISNKSIMDILHFDDADMNNMFKMQREELQKLQDKELDYREQIRVLVKENNLLKSNGL